MIYKNNSLYRSNQNDRDSYPDAAAQSYPASQNETGGMRQRVEFYLDVLYRRKGLLVISTVLVAIVLIGYTWFQRPDPSYRATSFLMVDLGGSSVEARYSGTRDNFFAESDRTLSDEIFILRRSSTLARRVAERIHFDHAEYLSGKMEGHLVDEAGEIRDIEILERVVRGMVDFRAERGSRNIIAVTAVSPQPHETAIVANLYAEEYERLTRDGGKESIAGSQRFFEDQAETWRDELRNIEASVQAYLSENATARLDQSGTLLVSQIADLEARRDDARIDLDIRRAALQDLESEIEQISPQVAEQMISGVGRRLQSLQNQIVELETSREQIRVRHQTGNIPAHAAAEIDQLDAKLAELQSEGLRLSQQYIDERLSLGVGAGEGAAYLSDRRRQAIRERTAIGTLEARIQVMEHRLSQLNSELQNVPAQSLQLAQLERSRRHAERMHEMVTSRMLEARLAAESDAAGYVRVVERGTVPSGPIPDNVKRNMILGVILAMVFGMGLVMLRESLENRFYKPDDIRKSGYPLLTVVPNLEPLLRDIHDGKEYVMDGRRQLATSLVTLLNPMTSIAESYRQLRSKIQFAKMEQVVQTLLVTSANMGEGKSVSAANLAIVMAQSGRRTLLIDGDLYRPRVHKLFGLRSASGMVQLLSNGAQIEDAVHATGIDDLYAIPAGKPVDNSEKLLTAGRFRDILTQMREQFDCIIIDTPPLRAMSDAMFLAPLCDTSIVVVRAGYTKEAELQLAYELLDDVGAHTLGTLFNGFDISMAYGYKYRYSKYSQYSQYSKGGHYSYSEGS